MAQQLLHCPYVVPVLEEVGGKRMAQRVAADVLRDSRITRRLLHRAAEHVVVNMMAADHTRSFGLLVVHPSLTYDAACSPSFVQGQVNAAECESSITTNSRMDVSIYCSFMPRVLKTMSLQMFY